MPAQLSLKSAAEARILRNIIEASQRLAMQRELSDITGVLVNTIKDCLHADRASCLFHDADEGILWSELSRLPPANRPGDEAVSDARTPMETKRGLAGAAVRTASATSAVPAASDPRYDRELDDPLGDGSERIVCHPVVGRDADGKRQVHAVLVAVYADSADPWADDSDNGAPQSNGAPSKHDRAERALATLAAHVSPIIDGVALHGEVGAAIEQIEQAQGKTSDVFVRDAIEAHQAPAQHGNVIQVTPTWLPWVYRGLLAIVAVAVIYGAIGTLSQYTSGSAVIRLGGRADVTSDVAGTVMMLGGEIGDGVRKGQVLATLYDAEESADFARLQREFELQVLAVLRAPGDEGARRALGTLSAQRRQAQARLAARAIYAPQDGTIGDILVREGQPIRPGKTIMSLVVDQAQTTLMAFFPGGDRPHLQPGLPLRLKLDSFPRAPQEFIIESVADTVVSPSEARRFVGDDLSEGLALPASVVIVSASAPATTFAAEGQAFHYHAGMQGIAEVRLRSQRILRALFPGD